MVTPRRFSCAGREARTAATTGTCSSTDTRATASPSIWPPRDSRSSPSTRSGSGRAPGPGRRLGHARDHAAAAAEAVRIVRTTTAGRRRPRHRCRSLAAAPACPSWSRRCSAATTPSQPRLHPRRQGHPHPGLPTTRAPSRSTPEHAKAFFLDHGTTAITRTPRAQSRVAARAATCRPTIIAGPDDRLASAWPGIDYVGGPDGRALGVVRCSGHRAGLVGFGEHDVPSILRTTSPTRPTSRNALPGSSAGDNRGSWMLWDHMAMGVDPRPGGAT